MSTEPWYVPILSSLLSGLVGAAVVYYFGIRQLVIQRRLAFMERQLVEFYAPLTGIQKQILAKSEIRTKVSAAANTAWQEICERYSEQPLPNHEQRFEPFKKIIEYDNEQLKIELIPKYEEMLKIFTERYHLAAKETRVFYAEFLEFVEIWNRYLAESLPPEVLRKLEHGEEKILLFYEHLESKMQQLQNEISRG